MIKKSIKQTIFTGFYITKLPIQRLIKEGKKNFGSLFNVV